MLCEGLNWKPVSADNHYAPIKVRARILSNHLWGDTVACTKTVNWQPGPQGRKVPAWQGRCGPGSLCTPEGETPLPVQSAVAAVLWTPPAGTAHAARAAARRPQRRALPPLLPQPQLQLLPRLLLPLAVAQHAVPVPQSPCTIRCQHAVCVPETPYTPK